MSLRVRDLQQRVPGGSGRVLYRDLSGEFSAGKITAVIGPNGSGKSTLLRTLVGLQAPEGGEVCWGDRPLHQVAARERARALAYLPQSTPLYHDLPVRELVMLGRTPFLGRFAPPRPEDHRAVHDALAAVAAESLADRGVLTLSGGERQRVMLARMLATQARTLILDEPTTALDIGHALSLLTRLRALCASGHTVILAMHELQLARRYADFALCLREGGGTLWGETRDVMTPGELGQVFGVRVEESGGEVSFHPRPNAP